MSSLKCCHLALINSSLSLDYLSSIFSVSEIFYLFHLHPTWKTRFSFAPFYPFSPKSIHFRVLPLFPNTTHFILSISLALFNHSRSAPLTTVIGPRSMSVQLFILLHSPSALPHSISKSHRRTNIYFTRLNFLPLFKLIYPLT